jgi:hypothetical protein
MAHWQYSGALPCRCSFAVLVQLSFTLAKSPVPPVTFVSYASDKSSDPPLAGACSSARTAVCGRRGSPSAAAPAPPTRLCLCRSVRKPHRAVTCMAGRAAGPGLALDLTSCCYRPGHCWNHARAGLGWRVKARHDTMVTCCNKHKVVRPGSTVHCSHEGQHPQQQLHDAAERRHGYCRGV